MPSTDASDPLRTTDHDPTPAPADTVEAAPVPYGSTSIESRTVTHVPVEGTDPEPASGSVSVPGYELLGVLGRGGMGVVYKARHLALKRTVALKMVLAGGHAGPEELARFRIEAEAVARLQHPNIVQIHEVGAAGGHPYCALEFVEGGSLAGKIGGKPLPAGEAARLVEALARAVQLAHSRNVVHRDLKPANVLLAADGTPKIADFGLARQTDSDSGQTQAGTVMGTPSYMAPEQASGLSHEAGPAADIYALGAILYDCLAGRPPFEGKTVVETLDKVRTQEPAPPSRWQAGLPADLETICLKCLRKEPEQRYASAAELADDLVRYQQGEPVLARPVGRLERAIKWAKRNPVVTGAAAAVVLAMTVSMTVSHLKYLDAEEQKGIAESNEREAQNEAEKAKKARAFLTSIFELSDANGQRGTLTGRQILADAEQRIPIDFADQPELRAELQAAVENVYAKITENAPLAMLLEVQGTVRLQPSREPDRRAVPQTLLYAGDRLSLAADARVQLVSLSDLHQERLQPDREVTVRRTGCEPADAVLPRDHSILMTFVRLPKGTFYMGWGTNPRTNKLARGVKTEIPEDFEIAVHDVTQGQWQALMGDNPSYFSRLGQGRKRVQNISDEELKLFPVESVTWNDVQEFLEKLNERERGRGYLYRLPTEAEWEYACRGGATTEAECSYHFYFDKPTNDLSSDRANFDGNDPDGKAPKGKSLQRATRVGAYPPNKLGLCDMHGNVWQWCADDFYAKERMEVVASTVGMPGLPLGQGLFLAFSDPTPERSFFQADAEMVRRGGGWYTYDKGGPDCRAAFREPARARFPAPWLGFRLARVSVRPK
jgi:serine/threonine protein kinase/formylglycine-generating enzyme required for sulfatase activity